MNLKTLLLCPIFIISTSFAATTVNTNVDNVPLQESNTSSKVLELIPTNTALESSGEYGNYYKVKYNDVEGYISKLYTKEGVAAAAAATAATQTTTTTSNIADISSSSLPTTSNYANCIIKTDVNGALPRVNETQLKLMINKSSFSSKAKTLLTSLAGSFVQMQETYKVNAAFAVAVTRVESSGGINGRLNNDLKAYNMFSIKGTYNGSYVTMNGSKWKKYPNFSVAVMDFGKLIAEGQYYFKRGKYTIAAIAPTYCNVGWGTKVGNYLKELYSAI